MLPAAAPSRGCRKCDSPGRPHLLTCRSWEMLDAALARGIRGVSREDNYSEEIAMNLAVPTPNPPGGASASGILTALRAAGVTHAVTVPDFVQFALHEKIFAADSGIAQVFACSEDQALTTATGLYIGGAMPVVMVQNQGFFKCVNTVRATCIDAGVPMVFLVGQFGRELENFGKPARESTRSMVRLIEPLLDALEVRYWTIDEEADIPRCMEAFAHAKAIEGPAVVLIGRHLTWQ
ncbi:thiamine pyrophosphate-binding protein [Paraburkholderia domus]|uniref:thiamine pyrophosphate-binding protein n=2 Tax=Paraburkholderia domus TaxID=2793075 RepID=UPI001BAB4529|nr:thiamine pyrophosphate-binding protein [Paraburkholderia domus]MCI0144313.1 thiamine pyrophosphate-binding protein [Paraburkholderia sediminicola]